LYIAAPILTRRSTTKLDNPVTLPATHTTATPWGVPASFCPRFVRGKKW